MGSNIIDIKTEAFGGGGFKNNPQYTWDEGIIEKLLYIYVFHSESGINSIQFVYEDEHGKIITSPRRGGTGSHFQLIEIKDPITKVSGSYWKHKWIANLKIEAENYCYGNFGTFENFTTTFSFGVSGGSACIKGFHGCSDGEHLRAIGGHIIAGPNAAESNPNHKPEKPKVKSEPDH